MIQLAEAIGGNLGYPFVGEALELFQAQELFYWKRFQRFGNIFKTRILGKDIVCLVGCSANQFVLKDGAGNFSSKIGWSLLEPLLGEGILLQDGERHRRSRKLMYPSFHEKILPNYLEIIQTSAEKCIDNWKTRSPVFLADESRSLTLQIACRLLLGVSSEGKVIELARYFSELIAGIRTVVRWNVPFTQFGRAVKARNNIERFLRSVIEERRKNPDSDTGSDVLGTLLSATDESGDRLDDNEIIVQALQLLFGAHETTAKLLCWSLFELSDRLEWREKIGEEGARVAGEEKISFEAIRGLTRLDRLLKEVERLYPPVYSIPRGVIREVEYGGYRIPAGWYVVLSPLLTHRSSELYTDPHRFDPDRFAPPREEDKQHPFALIGFGGGVHHCLGHELARMEIKVILTVLSRRYRWRVTADLPRGETVFPTNSIERKMRLRLEET
ncbi:cytochrome P450 [Pannus brasiliensis CCIBt3594]|uniref:Cytochrome P450 n=1 Tax=Pannus brasiliensis CCIBt3594 TaxID=1427578 RepID=A0AAW9QTX3_9CHRO